MRPVALYDSRGIIYGYACGRCREIGGHGQLWNRRPTTWPRKNQVSDSRRSAASCCTCGDCKRRIRGDRLDGLCVRCGWANDWSRAWGTIGDIVSRNFLTAEEYWNWLNDDGDAQ